MCLLQTHSKFRLIFIIKVVVIHSAMYRNVLRNISYISDKLKRVKSIKKNVNCEDTMAMVDFY